MLWNRDIPDGVTEEDVREYTEYCVERTALGYGRDRETLKLSYGVLLDHLVNSMKFDSNRFVIHSAHDNTIVGLLVAISNGSTQFPWPDYASSIVFEVWEKPVENENKEKEMKRFARVLYEKRTLRWPNGEEWMSVEDVEKMWKDVLVDEQRYLNVVCPC